MTEREAELADGLGYGELPAWPKWPSMVPTDDQRRVAIPRPTPLPVRVNGIPESLRVERRWVIWHYIWREGTNGKPGKWDKPPYIATAPEQLADSTKPTTWRSFNEALTAYEHGKCDGIGFVLGDGWVGFDADDTDAPEHVQLLNTYTERSPSGTGIHAIMRGTKPGTRCRIDDTYELYDHGRYFTVTGHHLVGTPATVEERTAEIATLYARLFPEEERPVTTPTGPSSNTLTDDELLTKARASKNSEKFIALWHGDVSGYPSHSEADLALCAMLAFWTNRNAAQMDRLFRRSGLMREKWDSRRGDTTIGADLIAKAIASTSSGFDDTQKPRQKRDDPIEDLQAFLQRIELLPEIQWFVPGLIPNEGICLWHGQPRDFKTLTAQAVALALAAGYNAFGSERFRIITPVKVAYFTEEDSERLFAARMHWLTVKNPKPPPGFFFPFIRKSLSFDAVEDREFIIRKILESGVEVSFFDPVRSYTGLSDKGPAELRPVALFWRRIQNETTAKTLVNIHHDTKPLSVEPINGSPRSRSQQASGGGIFSISDCPVSFTKLDWNKVAVYPEDYKLSGDPKPFEVTFETDERHGDNGPQCGSWIRPIAVTKNEQDITDGAAARKILQFLDANIGEWYSTGDVNTGAKLRNDTAGPVLKKLYAEKLVMFCTGDEAKALGHPKNANMWSGIAKVPKDQAFDI